MWQHHVGTCVLLPALGPQASHLASLVKVRDLTSKSAYDSNGGAHYQQEFKLILVHYCSEKSVQGLHCLIALGFSYLSSHTLSTRPRCSDVFLGTLSTSSVKDGCPALGSVLLLDILFQDHSNGQLLKR